MNTQHAIFQEMGFAARGERLPEAVLYSLARTASLLIRELSHVYQRFGLTPASFNLLMLLKHGEDPGAMTQQAIGRRLVVSPSDMTGLIDRLEQRGLVVRSPGKDRRSKLLGITPKGGKLLDAVWPEHVNAVERLTGRLNRSKAQHVVRGLETLRASLS